MTTARVSVVIPAYNAAHWLPETLDSVLAQTEPAKEIIVVNDGSSDNTEEVLTPYREAIRYVSQNNSGPAVARNSGIRASSGDFVAFLDADDIWYPDKIERQVAVLDARPDVGVVFSNYEPFGEPVGYRTGFDRGTVLGKIGKQRIADDAFILEGDVFAALLQDLFSWTSTVLVRRKAIDTAGGFDEALHQAAEDWTICLRLSLVTRFAYVNKCLARRREHAGSLSRIAPDNEQAVLALKNLLAFPALGAADRAHASDRLAHQLFTVGYQAFQKGRTDHCRVLFLDYLATLEKSSPAFRPPISRTRALGFIGLCALPGFVQRPILRALGKKPRAGHT
jgi:glycosyltransferase involved in cell wall biosynthesis